MYFKKLKFAGLNLLFLFIILSPFLVSAQAQGVQSGLTYECIGRGFGECNFDDLIAAVLHLVNWGTAFALGFSVIVIAYAGFKYMISGDNPGERKTANSMMTKVIIGIGFILGAWLIVQLITSGLGVNVGISNLTGMP